MLVGAIAPAVMASTVVLTQGPYSYSDGGEFTAVTTPTIVNLGAYSSYTRSGNSFQTFCVQTGTEFQPGDTYDYTVSLISLGGPGYPGQSVTLGNQYSYPLSEGAAWLYSQFARGTLANYDFSNASSDRQTDAGELQAAIWALQGGQSLSYYPNGGPGNTYYNEAATALGANVDVAATLSTDFGVEIMNLTQYNGGDNGPGYYQNQLVLVPPSPTPSVPDGGLTVALLGGALFGLQGLRRMSAK